MTKSNREINCAGISRNTSNVVALLTDFGSRSGYLSQIKATVLKFSKIPIQFINITSNITNFQIKEAAFILKLNYQWFPEGTIFIAVVDPDVGSDRQIIALESKEMIFIAPDNGILSPVIKDSERIVIIKGQSKTSDERDIYAKAASRLLCGDSIGQIGKSYTGKPEFLNLEPWFNESSIIGEIMHIDDFGNIISNIQKRFINNKQYSVKWENIFVSAWIQNYHALNSKDYVANIINSSGYLELTSYKKSAAELTKLSIGDTVSISLPIK